MYIRVNYELYFKCDIYFYHVIHVARMRRKILNLLLHKMKVIVSYLYTKGV